MLIQCYSRGLKEVLFVELFMLSIIDQSYQSLLGDLISNGLIFLFPALTYFYE